MRSTERFVCTQLTLLPEFSKTHVQERFQMLFSKNQVVKSDRNKNVAAGSRCGFLYVLNVITSEHALYASLKTLHARLCRSSLEKILKMFSNSIAKIIESLAKAYQMSVQYVPCVVKLGQISHKLRLIHK